MFSIHHFPVLLSSVGFGRKRVNVIQSMSGVSQTCARPFVAGESVEENAYVVLRLLIRRPECFGPALRGGEGNGLLAAMEEAITISEDPSMDGPCTTYQSNRTLSVYIFIQCKHTHTQCPMCGEGIVERLDVLSPTHLEFPKDLSQVTDRLLTSVIVSCNRDVVQDNDDDLIHMGHAIMTFYSALIDLLGRCAPEMHVSASTTFSSPSMSISTDV